MLTQKLIGRELKQDTIEFIKKQLLRSGFPLQLEVSSILRKRDYEVSNGVYFFDDDEKKAREFDIEAVLPHDVTPPSGFKREEFWVFNPQVAIECKKSAVYKWVFFRSEPIGAWFDIGHSIDALTEKLGYLKSVCGQVLSNSFLHYYKEDTIFVGAYQQVKLEKKKKGEKDGKDAILDAISKIIKFMNYRFQKLRIFFAEDPSRRDILFYFPLIVFDGELYEASFGKTLELKESRHLVYETRYLSSLTKSLVPLYIDIVRKDAFEEILSIIEKDVCHIDEYLKKPEPQEKLSQILERARTQR